MAFIRKRGGAYYLVHNVRKKGRVEQLHLASLGRRPRISDEIIRAVGSQHPFVRVDWKGLKEKASRQLVQPYENNSQYLRDLLSAVRDVHMDIADLHLPVLGATRDPDVVAQLTSALKLLRGTLDVKLLSTRKGKPVPLRNVGQG
jgi:hypothetical protein